MKGRSTLKEICDKFAPVVWCSNKLIAIYTWSFTCLVVISINKNNLSFIK